MFDISQEDEDDALITSLNTEATVRNVTFLPDNKMAIILDHEEVLMWKTDDSEAYKTFSREDFTVAIKRKITPWTYIGGCHHDFDLGKTFFLAGSSFASNPCLRVLTLNKNGKKLKPWADLSYKKNINVRCSALVQNTFITGSEDGLICAWQPQEDGTAENEDEVTQLKEKVKKSSLKSKKKPYEK